MNEQSSQRATVYLRVIGRLYPDRRLQLRPGYLSTRRNWVAPEDESALVAEVFDSNERTLGRFPLSLSMTCGSSGNSQAVRGWVPFHPDAQGVRYLHDGLVIHEVHRNPEAPEVALLWEAAADVRGKQSVEWRVRSPQPAGSPLQFFLRYSCTGGRQWQRISTRTTETHLDVDFDDLPGGDACVLALVATDGINTTEERSDPFQVALKPCRATIISPLDGGHYARDQAIVGMGSGYYLEENAFEPETLTWSSSIQGELGRGPVVEMSNLSAGSHRIRLTVASGPREGYDEVTIEVGESQTPAS